MSTDADDYAELRLLRLANAELVADGKRQAAQIEHLSRVNEQLVEQADAARSGANAALALLANTTAKVVNAELETQIERLTAEVEELRARVADNTTPATVLADVEELTNRDADEARRFLEIPPSNVEERIDRLMNIAFGPDLRDVKPLRVPRQGGVA